MQVVNLLQLLVIAHPNSNDCRTFSPNVHTREEDIIVDIRISSAGRHLSF